MARHISTISAKLITLLENARELAIVHQQRSLAADAVRACGIYAKNLKIGVPLECFQNLSNAIIDKPNSPLSDMFEDAQIKIIRADKSSEGSSV